MPGDELLDLLGASADGLTEAEAIVRLGRSGPNTIDTRAERPAWRLLLGQFASPIEVILVAATILSGALGDWTDAGIILAILLLSGVLGFVQEHSAGRAMAALLTSVAVSCTVLRDGRQTQVPIEAVVPGDIVMVGAGDLIPGDCRVLAATGLTVDESALTGETFPVDKEPGSAAATASLADRSNSTFLGTHVSSGAGRLLVVRTGRETELASIADRVKSRPPRTGFERGMTSFGLLLTRVMVVLVVVIFVINLLLQRTLLDSALFSLALAVGLTPQLLPAIVSLSLAQGARSMARRRVIVRRLDAIEDFGSMTILCSDKTGTMTAGAVELDSAVDLEGVPSAAVAELASMNSGLQLGWKNPIDAAIIAAHPVSPSAVALDEIPYDFQRKRLSVLVARSPGEDPVLITKGALEPILAVCSTAATPSGAVPIAEVTDAIQARFAALSSQGFRVLGIATRAAAAPVSGEDESGMTLVGLLCFADPAKQDAAATITRLADAGVSVRMVTGDNRLVAAHVAGGVGLDCTGALTGADIDELDETALIRAVPPVHVFSELDPLQKERVVKAFRGAGHVVGYLGDGINDSPPLHAADVGISVDTAVSVAKQAAAVVLLDKDLQVILDGVQQGRRTFANTMKYIFMTTSANFGNMLSMAVASLVLPFLPLLAGQILLINLLSDLPAMAIATDSVDERQLRRPQTWNLRLIRNYMLAFGALSSVFDLATFAILRWGFHAEAQEFRSTWFVASILTEVGVLFILRTRGPFYRSRPGRGVVVSSIVVALVTIALPYSPLAGELELIPVPAELLGLVLLITVGYLAATELVKRIFWRRRAPSSDRMIPGARPELAAVSPR